MVHRSMPVLAAALSMLLASCVPVTGDGGSLNGLAERVPPGTLDAATARVRLAQLTEAAPSGLAGYDRECDQEKLGGCVFGQPWKDTDGDGCDQRSQVLARDLTNAERKPRRCAVTAGTLRDPYTGDVVTSVSRIQVDHVVALAEMWRTGAAAWPLEQRVQAANDLRNLLAVSGKVNQAKGDQPAQEWLPHITTGYDCAFARIYVGVKASYHLTVTRTERNALARALDNCP